jgi:hypothetical protein
MQTSPDEYMQALPEDKRTIMAKLRYVVQTNLPDGFSEVITQGMINYVVPHSLYPSGYHCNPQQALPFISVGAQKNFFAVYHMGMYANEELLTWFKTEYNKHCKLKLDMGKSCIRFKKATEIPYQLLGELAGKMTPTQWIEIYEKQLKK